jgi:hypothetical protein
MLGLAGCSGDEDTDQHTHDTDDTCPGPTDTVTGDTGPTTTEPTGPTIISSEPNYTIKFADFAAMCTERGGLMQTHATCAGNNYCAGFHFNKNSKMFMEHTCKAMNSCGGISCVILPEDAGRTGEQIYNETCGPACHGGIDVFKIWVHPGDDPAATQAHYESLSMQYLTHMLAFGSRGMNESGTAYANVPHRHETHSVAELVRVMEYIKTLPTETEEFTILGENAELN